MTFINSTQTILRKSNGDILNFYIKDSILFYREFIYDKGWNESIQLLTDISSNQLDIKIDNNDRIYGIANKKNGKVLYIYTDNNEIKYKTFFEYDTNNYFIIYPFIHKKNSHIHVIYYLQDIKYKNTFGLINHYYDGDKWHQATLDVIQSSPIINPFIVSWESDNLYVFYFNNINNSREIFVNTFNLIEKSWSSPKQITKTNNKKLYLNVLSDDAYSHNITWSEFINDNLIVKFMKYYHRDKDISSSEILSLSEPANCSFPTFIKTGETLWLIWVSFNRLMSRYSLNNGKDWSESKEYIEEINTNFIKYKFHSNYKDDINNFKVNTIFGTYYPKISFIGFENLRNK